MDVHQEVAAREKPVEAKECHCSVCFKEINDIEAATHKLAGRYYCRNCRAMFGEKSHSNFVKHTA